ncbi:hypothetical protein QN357_13885 [Cryobacterium sp. RTC2.1]|uniref:hypothetical protein n=1 Tax=Cryobacterium sp. RTC2.1 TaxID=3048634 RepID=UPI002B231E0B|nr:hypothetical protein [Cryobacterium sp. RTC2.1]MEB0004017.1 hypothetical protein [Cryobacterium sp. RTC2.1]
MSSTTPPVSNEAQASARSHHTRAPKGVANGARIYDHAKRANVAVTAIVLTVASLVDVALAKSAFDSALRLPEFMSWFVAVGFSLVAVAGAFIAGVQAKHGHPLLAALAILAPATIAIALFVLRTHPTTSAAVGFQGQSSASAGLEDTILAPVMLLVFIGTAVLAVIDGYHLTDPLKTRTARVRDLRAVAADTVSTKRGRVVRIAEEKIIAQHVLQQVPFELAVALNALEATADEMKQWARVEIAQALGDPTATSGKTGPVAGVTTEKLPQKNDPSFPA